MRIDNEFSLPIADLVIGEHHLTRASGGIYKHCFPGNGEVQAEVPLAGFKEVDMAVKEAKRALVSWRNTPPSLRRDMLFRLADAVEANAEKFAWIGAREVGSPISGVKFIPEKFSAWTKYAAGWADKIEGRVISTHRDDNAFDFTVHEPFGVIGMILTWNGPLMALAMKLGPALATGNTVVLKPPEVSPFTASYLIKLAEEAGIPSGVINLVTGGAQVGEALVSHPDVDKIAFTGGTATASKIATKIGPLLKPAMYELGGKSANLIFADANMDMAIKYSARQPFFLAGQGCILPTRILVEESICIDFTERLIKEVESIRVGDPMCSETEFGPVISKHAQNRLLKKIDEFKSDGQGCLTSGGGIPDSTDPNGYFVEPTVFTDVKPNSPLAQDECFGPIIAISCFKDEKQAVAMANSTRYGLGAYIQSSNLSRSLRLSNQLCAGGVFVNGAPTARENAPFGGLNSSGFGREGGRDGLQEFLRVKNVAIASAS